MPDQSSTTERGADVARCTLSEPGRQQRVEWVPGQVIPHYQGTAHLDNGIRATFDAADASLSAVAQLIYKEAGCCSSFTFELAYEPPCGTFAPTITGPEGTRDLLSQRSVDRFDPVSGSDHWFDGSDILDGELPNDMQAALGQLIGEGTVGTLRQWVTVIQRHTDGHAMALEALCHASEPTAVPRRRETATTSCASTTPS